MAQKKILMLVGDFVEDYEAMVPYQMLLMTGHSVETVCPGKKPGETVKTAIHDFEGDQTYSEKPGHNFMITADFEEVDAQFFDALVIPGGRAPEYLRLNERVIEIVCEFNEANKPIAAICHGPRIDISAGIVRGVRYTSTPGIRDDLVNAGATWVDQPLCVDGHHVTSRRPDDLPAFCQGILKVMGDAS